MGGKLKLKSDLKTEGPFLLGKENLLELQSLLETVSEGLEKARINKQNAPQESSIGGITTIEFDLSLPNTVKTNIEISSKEEKSTLTDYDSIRAIWKDPKSKDFPIKSLSINIGNGGNNNVLELNIQGGSDGFIEYKLRCYDENILEDLQYEIDTWISKHKPKLAIKAWDYFAALVGILGGLFLFIFLITLFETEEYVSTTKDEARQLIDSGVTQANLPRAVNIMLKLQTEYVPANYVANSHFNSENFRKFIIWFAIYIIIIISPRTVMAIGTGEWKVKFYKSWIKLTMFTLPGLIVLPKIVEVIQKFIFK